MLSLANDVAARFEAGADRSVGGDGRSTRSIAKEVGVRPRIVSLWRHRYADHGLKDCKTSRGLASSRWSPDKRILKLLDELPAQRVARWTGPLLAGAPGDLDVQYVWRFLRSHKMDLAARLIDCLR